MKLFTIAIFITLLYDLTGQQTLLVNIGNMDCNNNCKDAFEFYVSENQTLILDEYQGNKYIYPSSINPGIGTFIEEDQKTEPFTS